MRLVDPGGHGSSDVEHIQLAEMLDFFPNLWDLMYFDGDGDCDRMLENSEVE